jgi:hypothetical protein
MKLPNQSLNDSSASSSPVVARIPGVVDESAQPGTHRQDEAPGEDQKAPGDRELYQPAVRPIVGARALSSAAKKGRYRG